MKAGIAIGSNLGDRLQNLQQARNFIVGLSLGRWQLHSPVYETSPIDCPTGSQPYLNAAVEIEFDGPPRTLLEKFQSYENAHGRVQERAAGVNAPRTIDIDILYFGDWVVNEPGLVIPHPRLAQRSFVLTPLAEIRPDLIIPNQTLSVRRLLEQLPQSGDAVKLRRHSW